MATKQEERYEVQSRPVSGASTQFVSGGKREGPTKTAAVVPVPEDSQFNSNFAQEQTPSTPLEGVDLNQLRLAKQPSNRQQTMERVKKEKFHTKAVAWEEAKNSEFFNRYALRFDSFDRRALERAIDEYWRGEYVASFPSDLFFSSMQIQTRGDQDHGVGRSQEGEGGGESEESGGEWLSFGVLFSCSVVIRLGYQRFVNVEMI